MQNLDKWRKRLLSEEDCKTKEQNLKGEKILETEISEF